MTKQEIINKIIANHQHFTSYLAALGNQDFNFSMNNQKWSAGQQADHIYRSVWPLKLFLGLPKWLTRLLVRKSNRPSKSYGELIEKYLRRLEQGGRASGRFVPAKIGLIDKVTVSKKIEKTVLQLCESLNKYGEQEIDALVLPHPLLGKLTLREMMYFTIYHVEHHHKLAIQNLAFK